MAATCTLGTVEPGPESPPLAPTPAPHSSVLLTPTLPDSHPAAHLCPRRKQ